MLQPLHCTGEQPKGKIPWKDKANVKGKVRFWDTVYAHRKWHRWGLMFSMSLQRMSEDHDYKYQQLHEQLGYVLGDAGLETAFYLNSCLPVKSGDNFSRPFFLRWSLWERRCQCWACESKRRVPTTLVCIWKHPSWCFHNSAYIHLSSSACEGSSC